MLTFCPNEYACLFASEGSNLFAWDCIDHVTVPLPQHAIAVKM